MFNHTKRALLLSRQQFHHSLCKNVGLSISPSSFASYSSSSSSEPRIVLLEGENIMTSKHKLCDRLKKVGYSVQLMTPHNNALLSEELLHNTVDAEELFSTSMIHHFLIKYFGNLNKFLEKPESFFPKIKNNVVFIDISPLYPLIYDPNIEAEVKNPNNKIGSLFNHALQVMKERNALVMQCRADRYESAYRLGNHKHFYTEDWSDNKTQQIQFDPTNIHSKNRMVEPLSSSQYNGKFHYFNGKYMKDEFEIVDYSYRKFVELADSIYHNSGITYRALDTTDTQQACCILLENELGIKFKLPFPSTPPSQSN